MRGARRKKARSQHEGHDHGGSGAERGQYRITRTSKWVTGCSRNRLEPMTGICRGTLDLGVGRPDWQRGRPGQHELRLSMVRGIQPKNSVEITLGVQMERSTWRRCERRALGA